jgi:hypothetical protein
VRAGPTETLASAVGDVDGDGRPDLVYTNQEDESLTVWRSSKGGIEGTPERYPTGRSASPALLQDLDGDGHVDLVAALTDEASLGVLWGRGGGAFLPMQRIFQGPPPRLMRLLLDGASRRLLLAPVDHIVMTRELGSRAGWPSAVTRATLTGAGTALLLRDGPAHTWVLGGDPLVALHLDALGRAMERRSFATWDAHVRPHAADLLAPRGVDELYGVDLNGQVTRHELGDGRAVCRLGPSVHDPPVGLSLADLDQDGVVDVVGSRTCAGCTSNQIVWWGGR